MYGLEAVWYCVFDDVACRGVHGGLFGNNEEASGTENDGGGEETRPRKR